MPFAPRKPGRPKGSPNKIPGKILRKLYVPGDEDRYELAKVQTMIRRLDRLADEEPHRVNMGDYVKLLERHTGLMRRFKARRGYKNDTQGLAPARNKSTEAEVGKGTLPSLDSGVPTDNPFT
jgi:hypothetical protein